MKEGLAMMKYDKYDADGERIETHPVVMTYEEWSQAFDHLTLWAKAEQEEGIAGTAVEDLEDIMGKNDPILLVLS